MSTTDLAVFDLRLSPSFVTALAGLRKHAMSHNQTVDFHTIALSYRSSAVLEKSMVRLSNSGDGRQNTRAYGEFSELKVGRKGEGVGHYNGARVAAATSSLLISGLSLTFLSLTAGSGVMYLQSPTFHCYDRQR